jgi:hypothetical protein
VRCLFYLALTVATSRQSLPPRRLLGLVASADDTFFEIAPDANRRRPERCLINCRVASGIVSPGTNELRIAGGFMPHEPLHRARRDIDCAKGRRCHEMYADSGVTRRQPATISLLRCPRPPIRLWKTEHRRKGTRVIGSAALCQKWTFAYRLHRSDWKLTDFSVLPSLAWSVGI